MIDVAQGDGGITILTAERPKWFEGGWIYTDPRTRTYDASGRVVNEKAIGRSSFSKGSLDRTGGKIYVRLDDTVIR